MQTSRFSAFPTVHSSFRRHRASIDHPRFPLNLTLSKPTTSPAWAALPTPPMSGSSPPQTPREISQLAGRRRKRSDTPPGTTSSTTTLPSLVEQSPFSYGLSPVGERREYPSMSIAAAQPLSYLPPLTYGAGSGLSLSHFSPPDAPVLGQTQISPRATRKTKAHVASACINCKKKHLRCDNSRPCRRCIQGGKEETCKDVEHKKRGRPPLKPEDPTLVSRNRELGPAVSAQYLAHGSASTGSIGRAVGGSGYPPILPSTQSAPYVTSYQGPVPRSSLYGGINPTYAAPTIGHSTYTATGGGFTYSRPPSASSSVPMPNPGLYHMPDQHLHQHSRQSSVTGPTYPYPSPQAEHSSSHSQTAQAPMYLREAQHVTQASEPHAGVLSGSGLQLPPIRPVAQTGYFDPTVTGQYQEHHQQQPQPQQQHHHYQQAQVHPYQQLHSHQPPQQHQIRTQAASPQHLDVRSESQDIGHGREPKRPKMDIQGILGPRHD